MILFLSLLLIIAFMINPKFLEASEIDQIDHQCHYLCYNKNNLQLYQNNKTYTAKDKSNFCAYCQHCPPKSNENVNELLKDLQKKSQCVHKAYRKPKKNEPKKNITYIYGNSVSSDMCNSIFGEGKNHVGYTMSQVAKDIDKFKDLTNFCSNFGNCKETQISNEVSCSS